jgi:hypothetical protein
VSVSASATLERGSVSETSYLDIVLVVVGAACALALGAPPLGIIVGAVAWIVVRGASLVADQRIAEVDEPRRQLGLGVALRMLRVWVLACAIIVVGVTSDRADALAAALLIFGAFSVHFLVSAVAHRQRKRMSA